MSLENNVFDVNLFLVSFENEFKNELKSLNIEVSDSYQLLYGNRLRPILFCWGYFFSNKTEKEIDYSKISKLAVPIELIHKASIITDDIVDNDDFRNSKSTFHKEHSINEGIIFSEFLIVYAIKLAISNCEYTNKKIIDLIINVILDMTKGGLDEIMLEEQNRIFEYESVNEILNLQTASLISNSLVLGYLYSNDCEEEVEYLLYKIGETYGQIFQIFNDLEPFSENKGILDHKGKLNFDISKKNIVMALLYKLANTKDKNFIVNSKTSESYYTSILRMIDKYKVRMLILNDIEEQIILAMTNLEILSKYNVSWVSEFKLLLNYLIDYSRNKI